LCYGTIRGILAVGAEAVEKTPFMGCAGLIPKAKNK
jgi:hypothetical protein